ncbi:hypothetical protein N22_020 [Idiomarinaceae phage 1N2-2]|uniref:hypothetical protein n=1 Tax=Idiomarinaceae phage 1N2-2 TaxID=1536592 RepID=UPI0004F738A2|nr:hypothetical protein N22_020 [Idiomarinaceae phage 1N2-2]AIM40722.1 hypothetical protein N22_020 [Idiomarinaceae phage 1N2-2]
MQREIELTWSGETVSVELSMKNVFRVERYLKSQGTNLMRMSTDIQSMSLAYSEGVMLVGEVLRCGGLKVTDEDVFNGLFGEGEVDEKSFYAVISDILIAFAPKPSKKPKPAPQKKPSTRRPATRSKKSTK